MYKRQIGNSLEVIEAVETLKGKGPADLTEVCLQLASNMLYLAGKGTEAECRVLAENAVKSGAALERLVAMVEAQGGDSEVILNPDKFEKAPYVYEVKAEKDGYITHIDAAVSYTHLDVYKRQEYNILYGAIAKW